MIRKIVVCVLLLYLQAPLSAQTVCFSYDAAGNRISRQQCQPAFAGGIQNRESTFEAEAAEKLTLIPNPTSGVCMLAASNMPPDAQIYVINNSGQLIFQQALGEGYLDLSACPAGTYFIHVSYGSIRKTALVEKSN